MIRNYTSSVPVERSVAFIEAKLSAFGANQILKKYDPKTRRLAALCFILDLSGREVPFKLPARIPQVEKRMLDERMRSRRSPTPLNDDARARLLEQAERTAWKILAEWVDMQLTLIELDQVKFIEMFMAFVYDPEKDQTYFERLDSTGFRALLPPPKSGAPHA